MTFTEQDIRDAFKAGVEKGNHRSYFDTPLDEDEYITQLKLTNKKDEWVCGVAFALALALQLNGITDNVSDEIEILVVACKQSITYLEECGVDEYDLNIIKQH